MLTYRFVETTEDSEAVLALVMKTYSEVGYVPEERKGDRLSINEYTRRQGSATINAYWNSQLCGTISIVKDSSYKLPADSAYQVEVNELRTLPGQLAEVCQFSVSTDALSESEIPNPSGFSITLGLFAHVVHLCVHRHIDHLCFVVHLKHRTFYESIGATVLGEEKKYEATNNVPVVLLHLNPLALLENTAIPKVIREVLDAPVEKTLLQKAEHYL